MRLAFDRGTVPKRYEEVEVVGSFFSTSFISTSAFLSAVGEEGRPSTWLKEGIFSSLFNVVIFRLCADSNGDSRMFNNRGAAGLSLFFGG